MFFHLKWYSLRKRTTIEYVEYSNIWFYESILFVPKLSNEHSTKKIVFH